MKTNLAQKFIAELQHQLKADHHPSDTVVVRKDQLKQVLRRAQLLEETFGLRFDRDSL